MANSTDVQLPRHALPQFSQMHNVVSVYIIYISKIVYNISNAG
jgi:hypothetical protein